MQTPIVFFHRSPDPSETLENPNVGPSYVRLAEFAEQKEIDLRFVLGEGSYKNGIFSSYWLLQNGTFQHISKEFTAEMIYAKSRIQPFNTTKRVNAPLLEAVCRDKLLTAQTFPKLVKKTIEINELNLDHVNDLKTELLVLKPRFGNNGKNVQVLSKHQITQEKLIGDSYVAQEFIDSSQGIPGLVNQRHEMRIYVFNGAIQSAYLRLPMKNSYLANVSQGATELQIDSSQIPNSFRQIISEIDSKFISINPRLYALDIMYENDRPWVVELNDTPGLPDVTVQPLTDNYLKALLELLIGEYGT